MPVPTSRQPGPTSHIVPFWMLHRKFQVRRCADEHEAESGSRQPDQHRREDSEQVCRKPNKLQQARSQRGVQWKRVAIHVHRVSARAHSRIECKRTSSAMRAVGSVCARRWRQRREPVRVPGQPYADRRDSRCEPAGSVRHQITTSNHIATIPVSIAQPVRITRNFHRAVDSSSKPIHELTQNARPRAVMSSSSRNRPDPRSCLKRPPQLN